MSEEEKDWNVREAAEAASAAAIRAKNALLEHAGSDSYRQALVRQVQAQVNATEAQIRATEAGADFGASVRELEEQLLRQREALAQVTQAQQDFNQSVANARATTLDLGRSIGLLGDEAQKTTPVLNALTASGIRGIFEGVGELINPMNLAGSVVAAFAEGTIELTMAFDNASVELNKTTGMANMFEDQISSLRDDVFDLGVEVGAVSANFGILATEIGTFTDMSESSQTSIARTVSVLDKFGISADQTAANINTMMASWELLGKRLLICKLLFSWWLKKMVLQPPKHGSFL